MLPEPRSLVVVESTPTLDEIFTAIPPISRWQYIYIHHSNTASGNAISLGQPTGGMGDHFLIGNGDGLMDGEIQVGQRWNQQLVALPPTGANKIDRDCISICLVGDFDAANV